MKTVRIKLSRDLPQPQVAFLSSAFEDLAEASSAIRENNHREGDWTMEWIMEFPPILPDLTKMLKACAEQNNVDMQTIHDTDWQVKEIPETNWLEVSYRAFPPFTVGPFFIYGSHYKEAVPESQIGLQIDAATAFGSGEHGTTKGCLEAMIDLKAIGVCPWNILDMGTGSGILAVAAWKLWHAPILAVDIDEESIRVAEHHCELNEIKTGKSTLLCAVSDGFKGDLVQKQKPYELILANILAAPLIEMAEDLVKTCDENGYVILSGMLHEQAGKVLGAYEPHGLSEKTRYEHGDWTTLVLQK